MFRGKPRRSLRNLSHGCHWFRTDAFIWMASKKKQTQKYKQVKEKKKKKGYPVRTQENVQPVATVNSPGSKALCQVG